MDSVTWDKKVKAAFPHGIRVVPHADKLDVALAFIETKVVDGRLLVGGWATDTMNGEYEVTSMEEKPGGWIVETTKGKYTFVPLTEAAGKGLKLTIEEEGAPWA